MARKESPDDDESIEAATRALADATSALTRIIGEQVRNVVPEVGEAVAASLREASRGLADASQTVGRKAGTRRADDRRRERVDRTRADLLDAAALMFAQRSYEGASVGDIAAEAGYTKGALYAHFGSKSELFLELARHRLTGDEENLSLPGLSAQGVDVDVLSEWLRSAQQDPRILLTLEFLSYGARNPESAPELATMYAEHLAALAEQIGELRRARRSAAGEPDGDDGIVQEDRDTALAVTGIATMSVLHNRLAPDLGGSAEAIARAIASLIER